MGTAYSNEIDEDNYGQRSFTNNDSDSENGEYSNDEEYNNYRLMQLSKVQQEAKELFEQKNRDYGDAFANYGVVGVLVRMGDKIQRGVSISKKGVSMVDNESLRDTLIDLANYATMAVMLLDEKKEE
jgi:DNA-binding protein YbaB